MLEDDNMNVTIAATGKEAIEADQEEEFDCIILDYTLPDISGTDLVTEVSKAKKKLTPVIVYSAKDFNKNELKQYQPEF